MHPLPRDSIDDILSLVQRKRHIKSARLVNREFAHSLKPQVSLTSDIFYSEWVALGRSGILGFIMTGDVYESYRREHLAEYTPLGKCYVLGALDGYDSLYYEVIYDGHSVNGTAFNAVDAYGYFTQGSFSDEEAKKEMRYGLNRDNYFGTYLRAEGVRFIPDHLSWLKILFERCTVFDLNTDEARKIVLQDFDYMSELVDMTNFYEALGYANLQDVRSAIMNH